MSYKKNYIQKSLLLVATLAVAFAGRIVFADSSDLRPLELTAEQKKEQEQIAILKEKHSKETDGKKKSSLAFQLGLRSSKLGALLDAEKYFREAIQLRAQLEDYAFYYLAKNLQQQQKLNESKEWLKKLLSYQTKTQLASEARYELGVIAIEEQRYKEALDHFNFLERKLRGSDKYPQLIWYMIKSEIKLNRKFKACRWAEKLYAKYPAHPLVQEWGIDLQTAPFDGKPLGCLASLGDQKTRLQNLQLSGFVDKAKAELDVLKSRASRDSKYHVDSMTANLLINDGQVETALAILAPHAPHMGNDFTYLMLLGKAAARASEYQTAVGAYYRAYQLRPLSKFGKTALYQAAFLSYQFQDYDGAGRKFEEFIRRFGRSGLSQDARWHLSWIRYLKGDYVGAAKSFQQLYNTSGRNKSKIGEKVRYWTAMSLYRQQRYSEARPILESLASSKLLTYYSMAAIARLQKMAKEATIKQASSENGSAKNGDKSKEKLDPIILLAADQPIVQSLDLRFTFGLNSSSEENESEENFSNMMAQSEEEAASESAVADGTQDESLQTNANENADSSDEAGTPIDEPKASSFRDPTLAKRFDRASELADLGLLDWARQELFEIERRTTNKTYLRNLLQDYYRTENYYRASYIGQVNFQNERANQGIKGATQIWQFAYPQAYKSSVAQFSKKFNVQEEMIWSIMRAESQYRPYVRSPVGAIGLMQLMPHTGTQIARLTKFEGFAPEQLTTPDVNIHVGTGYLQRLGKKLKGKVPLVAAAYNAGPHRVEAWLKSFGKLDMDEFIEHIPFLETRNYTKNVSQNFNIYHQVYFKDTKWDLSWLAEPVGVEIEGKPSPKETWEELH